MDREKLIQRLMVTFLDELEGHVQAMNRDLLALEKVEPGGAQEERLRALFRTAHTLKSAARAVSLQPIEQASHQLEEILTAAREGRRPLSAPLFALLFESVDAVQDAGQTLRAGKNPGESALARILPRLEAAARGEIPPPAVSTPTESADAAAPSAPRGHVAAPAPSHAPNERPRGPVASPAASPPGHAFAASGSTVRISAEKLDTLLAECGELRVALQWSASRSESIEEIRAFVGRWTEEWLSVEKALCRTLESLLPPTDPSPRYSGEKASRAQAQPEGLSQHAAGRGPNGHALGPLPRRTWRALRAQTENLRRLQRELERLRTNAANQFLAQYRASAQIDEEVRRLRMLPFRSACEGLDRMVRDFEKAQGKGVDIAIEGGEVELDRSALEALKGPLVHLVRNALDHGIEGPQARRAAGKPPRGRITVEASLCRGQVQIAVADDGQGLSTEAIRARAARQGLPVPENDAQAIHLIFLPGFSTSPTVTELSGRGVGLDVVQSAVEALHGSLDVSTVPGQGTRFLFTVPLTLTTLRALLVRDGGQVFALPALHVQKVERLAPGQVQSVQGRPMAALGASLIPIAALAEALGLRSAATLKARGEAALILASAENQLMGFVADEALEEQEIVVQSLGPRLRHVRSVSGATSLPNGRIALILNVPDLLRHTLQLPPGPGRAGPFQPPPPPARKRLLLVEDSLTTRALEKSILEGAGYDVLVASDGAEGWQVLQEKPVDLVISDIEMPRMDGFELTEAIRKSKSSGELPVILVSGRASDEDRARGIGVGADAYIVKSAFDQTVLLETIGQFL
ncbi:MAG: hybrid sensor histidine kinase/response regulator [Planctomycetes bacterium]|nr:hybrid sensor histidine kinase/response regulator [Planctomycetota bacterium]